MLEKGSLATLAAAFLSVSQVLGGGGCFAESQKIVGEPTTGTSGGECSPGAQGCDCYGNGTCDAGLSCAVSVGLCIPDGCTPGELNCECADGACLSPLVCEGGLCADAGSSGDSETTAAMTSTDVTTSPSTTSSSMETTTAVDEGTTTGSTSLQTSASEDDTAMMGCSSLDCAGCLACVSQQGEACGQAYMECQSSMACLGAAECQVDCAVSGLCWDDCCAMLDQESAMDADTLNDCRGLACVGPCGRFDFVHCG